MCSPRCVSVSNDASRARVPSRCARPTNSKSKTRPRRLTLVDDDDDATQRGARRAHDVAVSMCSDACGTSETTIEEAVANLQRVVDGLTTTAATTRARADMSRESVETSERALKDTLEACGVAREALCEEFARVRARGERALERLATPASVKAAKERRRAESLRAFADVLETVVSFSQGGRMVSEACGGVFVDKARVGDAVRLAKRALDVAERASSEVSLDVDALDIERKVFGDAASALARFWSEMENALLGDFTKACDAKSYASAQSYAELLFSFNGGANVTSRYVSSHEMFISEASMAEIRDMRYMIESTVSSGRDEMGCKERVDAFFARIQSSLRKEFQTIVAAFGSRAIDVFNAFVSRILEQRIGALVETFLTTEIRTVESLRQRLAMTAQTLRDVDALNETIADIVKGDARATRIDPDALFGIGCESLLDDECACLDSAPTDDELLSFTAADLPAGPAMDVVCDAYEGAVRRCESCVSPSTIDDARDRLTHAFLDRVLRLSQIILRDTVGGTKASSARFGAHTTRDEAVEESFAPILRAAADVNRWFGRARETIDGAVPEASRARAHHLVATAQQRLANELWEIFRAAKTRCAAFLDAKFRALQRAGDFSSDSAIAERETHACDVAVDFLRALASKIRQCLDPTNAAALLNEIGEEFYALLFMHVCRFKYTMIGGMQLKLDVNAYVQWARATVTDRVCVSKFERLSSRCNVLVVGAGALTSLVEELEEEDAEGEHQAEIGMMKTLRL